MYRGGLFISYASTDILMGDYTLHLVLSNIERFWCSVFRVIAPVRSRTRIGHGAWGMGHGLAVVRRQRDQLKNLVNMVLV